MDQKSGSTKSAKKKQRESWRKVTASVISAARRDHDLTQKDLAAKLGLTRETIGNMEAARRKIEVGDVVMIAQAIGVEPERLFRRILGY